MSDITNFSGGINRLRNHQEKVILSKKPSKRSERRFAIDYFMLVAYSLLGAAVISQIFLIAWLDII